MRTITLSASVALGALLIQGCSCRDDEVSPIDETDPLEGNDIGQWLSMALDAEGRPAISFYDRTKGAVGFACGTFDSNGDVSWDNEKVDGYAGDDGLDPGDRGKYTSLAFDSSGIPWIAYQDGNNGVMYVAKRLGHSNWEAYTGAVGGGATPDAGYYNSLAFDANDNPVVAFYDKGVGELKIAHWNGSAFTATTVDAGEDYEYEIEDTGDTGGAVTTETISADVGQYASLLIDGSTEFIAYYDVAWGALKLAVGAAGNYTIYTVDDDGDVGGWPTMTAYEGDLVIAYQEMTSGGLKIARGSGNDWTIQTVDDGARVGADTHIFSRSGELEVVYFDGYDNDMKHVATASGAWGAPTAIATEGALGYHNEVVLIGETAYAACYDYTGRDIWFSEL